MISFFRVGRRDSLGMVEKLGQALKRASLGRGTFQLLHLLNEALALSQTEINFMLDLLQQRTDLRFQKKSG